MRNEPLAMADTSTPNAPFEGPLSAAEAEGGGGGPLVLGAGTVAAGDESDDGEENGDKRGGRGDGDCQ